MEWLHWHAHPNRTVSLVANLFHLTSKKHQDLQNTIQHYTKLRIALPPCAMLQRQQTKPITGPY